jgi:hypothetical protein
MEETEGPLNDLLKTLELSLTNLLQKVRQDPWSLLIFQTLLWSFRRWAIHYLVSTDTVGSMQDYLWESHIELVRNYAPEGLQEFGVVWLSPSNVGDRADNLEELNSYFLFIVDRLNICIEDGNEDEQNLLSIFLDETLTEILDEWLENLSEYRIYPGLNDPSDSFPTEKIFTMMQRILEKTIRIPQKVELPAVAPVPAELPNLHDANFVAPEVAVAPVVPVAPVVAAAPEVTVASEVAVAPEIPVASEVTVAPIDPAAPAPESIRSALRKRTLRLGRSERKNLNTTRNRRKFPTGSVKI